MGTRRPGEGRGRGGVRCDCVVCGLKSCEWNPIKTTEKNSKRTSEKKSVINISKPKGTEKYAKNARK